MIEETKVTVSFRSFNRDREEGYEVTVTNQANDADVRETVEKAALARSLCLEVLVPFQPADSARAQLLARAGR